MLFGFALDSWNIDLLDIDLLDTDLVLLVGHGEIQIFPVNILFISKTSSKGFQDMSSRRLQGVFKMSWKTKNCYAEDESNDKFSKF